ncbi:MAG: histidine--tRNA ligase [Patescibacteria group bacterium]
MVNVQLLKGFRDFLPSVVKKREYVLNTLKKVFESYGFEPLETPSLEYEEILTGKYGDEGDKLMYKFKDLGGRNVALRYDQTVPLARVIAKYAPRGDAGQNELPIPFKRYQIQNVWRAENTQKGRYREFLQVDIDTVGVYSPLADAEILSLVYKSYSALGLKIKIVINDRKQLSNIDNKYLMSIDKVGKISEQKIIKELEAKGLSVNEAEETFNKIKSMPKPDSVEIVEKIFQEMGNPKDTLRYVPVLIRGLDYYTGLIFEVLIENQKNTLSFGGGGRYDNLIGIFAGRDIPAVGFSFGFDRLIEAMEELKLFPKNLNGNNVFVAFSSSDLQEKALEITIKLRAENIASEFYLEDASLEKQLKYADKKQVPYSIIVSDKELIFKDMEKRIQEVLSLEDIIKKLK